MSHLLEDTRADAALGRMTQPVPIESFDSQRTLLHPRFANVKHKEEGPPKVRSVDHMSWSAFGERKAGSVNGHTAPNEKLGHDSLDAFADLIAQFIEDVGVIPGLMKADISSAFRRIPICPEHRWAAGIAFKQGDTVWCSQHLSCMFGAVASVHGWERIGAAIAHLGRVLLKLPLLRYVDDYFAPDRHVSLCCLRWGIALVSRCCVLSLQA